MTARDSRLFLEAVFRRVGTGSPWRDLPAHFGKWNSQFRRFRHPVQPPSRIGGRLDWGNRLEPGRGYQRQGYRVLPIGPMVCHQVTTLDPIPCSLRCRAWWGWMVFSTVRLSELLPRLRTSHSALRHSIRAPGARGNGSTRRIEKGPPSPHGSFC